MLNPNVIHHPIRAVEIDSAIIVVACPAPAVAVQGHIRQRAGNRSDNVGHALRIIGRCDAIDCAVPGSRALDRYPRCAESAVYGADVKRPGMYPCAFPLSTGSAEAIVDRSRIVHAYSV